MKYGFTLVEVAAVLAISGTLMMADNNSRAIQIAEKRAAAYGQEIFEYNAAVSRYITYNSSDPDSAVGVYNGSQWLHPASCGGSAPIEFLYCEKLPDDSTRSYVSMPTTTITKVGSASLEAKTVWSDLSSSLKNDSFVKGVAALTASGAQISTSGGPSSGGTTVYCPDIVSFSPSISAICSGNRDKIISKVSTTPNTEQ